MNAINLRVGVATTNIRDIKPQAKATVYLQGKVVQLVPLLERQVSTARLNWHNLGFNQSGWSAT